MQVFRSILFNLCFYLWSIIMVAIYVPALWRPHTTVVSGQRHWARHVNWLMRHIAKIDYEIRGLENLPERGCLIAAKHQSAWDTLIWHLIVDDPAVVMKQELLKIPIYGAYCRKSRMITVDRAGGAKAMRAMLQSAQAALDEGRPIIIFPQGTRTAPGTPVAEAPYLPGVAALYRGLDAAVVPVALNSGLFWPRRSIVRRPGTIVLEYLPAIAPGKDRKRFLAELEERIETATTRLEDEGKIGPESSAKGAIKSIG